MAVREQIGLDEVIAFLNEVAALDREAVERLVAARAPCNEALSSHPSVQVGAIPGGWEVGLLGVLNGLFGAFGPEAAEREGWGPIAAVYEGGALVRFERTRVPGGGVSGG